MDFLKTMIAVVYCTCNSQERQRSHVAFTDCRVEEADFDRLIPGCLQQQMALPLVPVDGEWQCGLQK